MAALNIKNGETVRLAKELAAIEGKSLTRVVTEALREKLERERVPQIDEERMQYILDLGRQVREHMERVNPEWLERDPTDDLYDEDGLPN
jgi:antitoxin VapB